MKSIRNYITALLAIAMLPALAQQKQTPPAGGKAKDFKLSDNKNATLSNGLKTTMVHYGELPKVTVSLIIKTGNAHERADQVWLADLTG
ncbi:MAG: M16 family metallopeptidase, partial [Flavisolibacter sp.]